ncbi:MAG TPA: hypothetical protein PL017_11435 [Tenuifilaceae bacterium]|nr:hypothetical protein [Tenuifilaceae bacterium]HPQ34996.1 hypothetical protein [Tenuifilaceae bacterium]HRX68562.1 hypothetical protein [Tenuifilaceae bacterium]
MKKYVTLILLNVCILFIAKSQDSIAFYSLYQITNAWQLTPTDTTEITETFNDDYYFAFFVEDTEGKQFFTVKGYETNKTFCIGDIAYDFSEGDSLHQIDFYSSKVYCNSNPDDPAESVVMEYIHASEEETGYPFYYLWVLLNESDALLFLCFDTTETSELGDGNNSNTPKDSVSLGK